MIQVTRRRFLLLFTIILGGALRYFRLATIPVSLYWDEAAHLLELKLLFQTGLDQFSLGFLQSSYAGWGDFKLPAYTWFSFPLGYLPLPPELWVRALSAAAGIFTLAGLYHLACSLKLGSRTSLLTAFAASISPWLIQFSRAGFEANLALMWLTLSACFYLMYLNVKRRLSSWLYLLLFSLSTFFGLYSYYSFRWAVVGLVAFLVGVRVQRSNWNKILLSLIVFGVVMIVGLVPQYWGERNAYANRFRLSAANIFTNTRLIARSANLIAADGDTPLARKLHHRFLYYGHDLVANILSYFDGNYLLVSGDANLRHSTGRVGLLYWWQGFGLLVGIGLALIKKQRLGFGLILLWLWLLIPGAITYESPHAMRSLNAVLPMLLSVGLGWSFLSSRVKKNGLKFILAGLVLLSVIELNYYLHDYYTHYPARSASAWQDGYAQAFRTLNQVADVRRDPIVITDTYFLPHLYFLLYTDYPLPVFQAERTRDFAQTGRYPFGQTLGTNIRFVSQNQLVLIDSQTNYLSSQKLKYEPAIYTEIPITDTTGRQVFYLYTPVP